MSTETENKNEIKTDSVETETVSDDLTSLADAAGIIEAIPEEKPVESAQEPKQTDDGNKKSKRKKKLKEISETAEKERKELDEQVKEILDDALDEDTESLGVNEDEQETSAVNISLSQILTAVFGLVVLGFAIFGIVTAIIDYHAYAESKNDNSALISSLERLVLPLSAADVPSFENTSLLNQDVIITAACWDVILNPSSTYTSENGYYSISYFEIDSRIIKLFGSGLSYTHGTVGDEELSFEYDESTGMYSIPVSPRSMAYYAVVQDIEATDDGYTIQIAYYMPINNWTSTDASPEKIMTCTVVSTGPSYTISSLQVSEIINGAEY
ncbi:MAG: hypothetical protein LUG23_06090 [Oscillospiraceae bacterium]|nr:hypothetical protein [Oscillospiraceae bacterium]